MLFDRQGFVCLQNDCLASFAHSILHTTILYTAYCTHDSIAHDGWFSLHRTLDTNVHVLTSNFLSDYFNFY